VLLAIPVGLAFNGTVVPLLAGVTVLIAASLALMRFGLPAR
jgi:MFS transporter, DHA1 family, multidrug resistance protein